MDILDELEKIPKINEYKEQQKNEVKINQLDSSSVGVNSLDVKPVVMKLPSNEATMTDKTEQVKQNIQNSLTKTVETLVGKIMELSKITLHLKD